MIHELDRTDYHKASRLFGRLKDNAAIVSIFEHRNEARIFVDDVANPRSAFVLTSWAYYYLAGDSGNDEFNSSLVDFFGSGYAGQAIREGLKEDFAFYPDSDEWCGKVEELFPHLGLTKSGKTYFNYVEGGFNGNWRDHVPDGFAVRRISAELIDEIKDNEEFVEYIQCFWGTTESFLKKGFGYCALDDHEFATICISVFASENDREVGIKTFQDFRRRGLAYVTACAFIEECLEKSLVPVWSCFSENGSSIELAKKLGYEIQAAHPIYFASMGKGGD